MERRGWGRKASGTTPHGGGSVTTTTEVPMIMMMRLVRCIRAPIIHRTRRRACVQRAWRVARKFCSGRIQWVDIGHEHFLAIFNAFPGMCLGSPAGYTHWVIYCAIFSHSIPFPPTKIVGPLATRSCRINPWGGGRGGEGSEPAPGPGPQQRPGPWNHGFIFTPILATDGGKGGLRLKISKFVRKKNRKIETNWI